MLQQQDQDLKRLVLQLDLDPFLAQLACLQVKFECAKTQER